jgi:hypothetical protein
LLSSTIPPSVVRASENGHELCSVSAIGCADLAFASRPGVSTSTGIENVVYALIWLPVVELVDEVVDFFERGGSSSEDLEVRNLFNFLPIDGRGVGRQTHEERHENQCRRSHSR